MFWVFGMKYRTGASYLVLLLKCLAAALFIAASAALPASALTMDGDGFYLIASSAELAKFRDAVNAGSADICARLTADIDLSVDGKPSDWEPIGSPIYSGTFDGGGHTVSGYVVTNTAQEESDYGTMYYSGFFAKVGDASTAAHIKNLILRGDVSAEADGYLRAGGLVGIIEGKGNKISNCVHIGNVYGETTSKTASVGGLAGYNGGAVVSDSFHSGDVFTAKSSTTAASLGGFIGQNQMATSIVNCGWQSGSGVGQNYAFGGVSSGSAHVEKISADIAQPPIVTTISANIADAVIDTDTETLVKLAAAPSSPNNVSDYISNAQVVENSYNRDIIEVKKKDGLQFSITPRAAGKTPVTFTAELRPTDFAQLPNFMPVAESEKQQMSMTIEISVSEAPPLPDIRVEPPSADMTVGERLALVAVAANGEAFDDFVTWASGDESVVTVDADGMAIAVSKGSAAVTASTEDGRSAVCSIKVSETPEAPDEPVVSPVSPDVEPEPDTPGTEGPDVPPSPAPAPSSGGGCSAGFGFPAAAALAFFFFMKRK